MITISTEINSRERRNYLLQDFLKLLQMAFALLRR
jgi:hypothetical protein